MGKHLNDYPRGAAARLPHHLALQDHQALGQLLAQAEAALTAMADVLVEAYGKSAEATRYAAKLLDTCGVLRGHLARAVDSEHAHVDAAVRQMCYRPSVEDQG